MEGMERMSLDRWKIHFQHSFRLLKHSLINMIFVLQILWFRDKFM